VALTVANICIRRTEDKRVQVTFQSGLVQSHIIPR